MAERGGRGGGAGILCLMYQVDQENSTHLFLGTNFLGQDQRSPASPNNLRTSSRPEREFKGHTAGLGGAENENANIGQQVQQVQYVTSDTSACGK